MRPQKFLTALFGKRRYVDPELGELTRSGPCWEAELTIQGSGRVPAELSGNRKMPDEAALSIARELPGRYGDVAPDVQEALFGNYISYRLASEEGETHLVQPFPQISDPADVWQRVRLWCVRIEPLAGQPSGDQPTLELVFEVDWDEDHLVGVRMQQWRVWEVCGSA